MNGIERVVRAILAAGRLASTRWSEVDLGWNTEWTLAAAAWTIPGVWFDEAFRAGGGGMAKCLLTP